MLELEDSTESLLMEALRQLDEFRRHRARLARAPRTASHSQTAFGAAPQQSLKPLELDVFQLVLNHGLDAARVRPLAGDRLRNGGGVAELGFAELRRARVAGYNGTMPELPDVTVYIEALEARVLNQVLEQLRLASPFVLRSVQPRPSAVAGKSVVGLRRLGKRVVFELEDDFFVVVHLMIAGRFRWKAAGAKVPGRVGLAAFDFSSGTLLLTEASTKKRASIHIVQGEAGLEAHDRGGLDVLGASLSTFKTRLTARNHTLKRALTDARLFDGIGNAYSDEILFAAKLSPLKLTQRLTDEEIERLFEATKTTLTAWTDRLREEAKEKFPEKVTAFRPEMYVHGKYKEPCRVCGSKVMRIAYAENEVNYCPRCQNEGRLLADRSLSRLLKNDWPKTVDELEG